MSIGHAISKDDWNSKKQRLKGTSRNSTTFNTLLQELSLYVERMTGEYKIKGERLSKSSLINLLRTRLYGNDDSIIYDYALRYIKDKKIKSDTAKSYKSALNHLNKFSEGITFNDINSRWHKDFILYLGPYKPNYINTIMRRLYEIINTAYNDEIHNNRFHLKKGFSPSPEQIDSVFLAEDELDIIYNNLNSLSESHKNTAITFLIGAYTGQRWQTYNQLDKSMILIKRDVEMITIKQQKGKHWVSIPLTPKLKSLLDLKRNKQAQQKLNSNIKEICRELGIEKWAEISSHTARRSYATNRVLEGMDLSLIMSVTGHKTEKEFRKYVRMDDVLAAIKVDQFNRTHQIGYR